MKLIRSTALAATLLASAVTANAGLITSEDFSGGATGWSDNRTSVWLGNEVLGGFNVFGAGAYTEKTFSLSGNQAGVNISFDFWKGDSWDFETFSVLVNNTSVFSKTLSTDGSQLGGRLFTSWNELLIPINLLVPSNENELTLAFTSNLNQSAFDEWWAIDNVVISEVPEPATIALLGLGLLGLGLSRKKKA